MDDDYIDDLLKQSEIDEDEQDDDEVKSLQKNKQLILPVSSRKIRENRSRSRNNNSAKLLKKHSNISKTSKKSNNSKKKNGKTSDQIKN